MTQLRTYYRIGIAVLLVALLAGLLPAHTSLAQSARLARNLSVNEPIDVPAEAVRANFWVANAMNRVDGPRRAEMVAFELVLMHMYKQNPDLPAATTIQKIRDLEAAYRNSSQPSLTAGTKTANENVLSILAILSSPPLSSSSSAGAIVAAAREVYARTLRDSLTDDLIGANRILGATETFYASLAHESAQQTILSEALALAQQNQLFGQAFDALWQADLHVSIYASTDAIIQSSPSLSSLHDITDLIDDTGAIHTNLGDLRTLAEAEFSRINIVATKAISLLVELDAHQSNLVEYARNDELKKADKAKADDADKKADDELDKAKETIEVVSNIVKLVDNKFAKDVEVIGGVGIKLAEAVSKYAKDVAGLGVGQALFSFSTLTLTGNVIGAVMALMPLFAQGNDEPETDEQILEQVGKLREQVSKLSQQMSNRFDRVDKSLNAIYTTLNVQFAKINLQLGRLTDDLHAVQRSLAEIQQDLNRMEQHLVELLSDGFQHPLLLEMNGAIGYREKNSGALMSWPEYGGSDGAENVFQTWATYFAFDSLAVGPSSRSYNDIDVYDELTTYPLDTNINYLSRFINQRWSLPPLSNATIANPRIWSLSARAYTELELDWPNYAIQIAPSRAAAVLQKGLDLQMALRKISTLDTASGPQPNSALFDRLIANYNEKVVGLNQAIQTVEDDYLLGVRTSGGRVRTGTIDLWGGANQPILPEDQPPGPTLTLCGGAQEEKPAPSNFGQAMLPVPFHVAYYLDVSAVTSAVAGCYDAEWVDMHTEHYGTSQGSIVVTYGKLKVTLTAKYTGGSAPAIIRTRFVTLPEEILSVDYWPPIPDPRAAATARWAGIKAQFEANSEVSYDSPTPADVVSRVEQAFKPRQRDLYQRVADKLGMVGPAADAAKRLTGAKALLDSFIALGLPRALETDEYFRSFLYGDQRLLDEDSDHRLIALWLAAKDTPPDHNARTDIMNLISLRANALQEVIRHYLDLIKDRKYSESHRMIDTTLDRLKIANAMVRTPVLSLSAGSINFGNQLIGAASATRTITLTNSGLAAPISISGISLQGANAGDFGRTSTCGTSLPASASCTITLAFTPAVFGAHAAELRIDSNAPGAPHIIPMAGAGWLDAVFNAPAPVAEGSPIELSLRKQSDPSNPNPWGPDFTYAFDCGDGYGSFGPSADVSCPTDDNGLRTIKTRVKYKGADLVEYTAPMTITNIAPTASFVAPAAVNEGGAIDLALQGAADPSGADTAAGFSYAFDCGAGYGAFGSNTTATCPTDDSGDHIVKGKVKDKDDDVTEYTATVAVANVAPTAGFAVPATGTEGQPITMALQSAADPSSVDVAAGFSYAFDCGAGYSAFGASSTVACTLPDSGARMVKGKVKDKDQGTTEYTATVAVANVAPTAGFVAPASVAEGSPINLVFQNPVDAPGDLPTLQYSFDCGTGYGAFGPSKTIACPTTDNGTRAIKGKVKDKDGGVTEYSASVTVANLTPTASFAAPSLVYTGRKFSLSLDNAVDAPGDLPSLQYAFDCGDGAGYGAFEPFSGISCTADAAGVRTVRGKVKDKDGAINEYSASVTIQDPLTLTITAPAEDQPFMVDTPVDLLAAFTERSMSNTHTCSIDWGDGTEIEEGTVNEGVRSGTCEAKHGYTAPGQYTIKVSVTNTFGDSSTVSVTIFVKTISR
jgi:hypothetical protein